MKNSQKSQFCYLEKGVLELCWAATIKSRKIERSIFFLLDHNGQTWIYRLVSSSREVRFQRNRDFPTEDDKYGIPRVKREALETGQYMSIRRSRSCNAA